MSKYLVLYMNCHSEEIIRNLFETPLFRNGWELLTISTYEHLNNVEQVKWKFEKADVLICNPIQSYPNAKFENISSWCKPDCLKIRLGYYRFNGFWPLSHTDLNTPWLKCLPDEFGMGLTWDEYNSRYIHPDYIKRQYQEAVDKLYQIDRTSDIKMADWIIARLKTVPVFSDRTHPMPNVFAEISRRIIYLMGYDYSISELEPYHLSRYFRSVIRPDVARVLQLEWYDQPFFYLGAKINNRQLYEWLNTSICRNAISKEDIESKFRTEYPKIVRSRTPITLFLESKHLDLISSTRWIFGDQVFVFGEVSHMDKLWLSSDIFSFYPKTAPDYISALERIIQESQTIFDKVTTNRVVLFYNDSGFIGGNLPLENWLVECDHSDYYIILGPPDIGCLVGSPQSVELVIPIWNHPECFHQLGITSTKLSNSTMMWQAWDLLSFKDFRKKPKIQAHLSELIRKTGPISKIWASLDYLYSLHPEPIPLRIHQIECCSVHDWIRSDSRVSHNFWNYENMRNRIQDEIWNPKTIWSCDFSLFQLLENWNDFIGIFPTLILYLEGGIYIPGDIVKVPGNISDLYMWQGAFMSSWLGVIGAQKYNVFLEDVLNVMFFQRRFDFGVYWDVYHSLPENQRGSIFIRDHLDIPFRKY